MVSDAMRVISLILCEVSSESLNTTMPSAILKLLKNIEVIFILLFTSLTQTSFLSLTSAFSSLFFLVLISSTFLLPCVFLFTVIDSFVLLLTKEDLMKRGRKGKTRRS